MVKLKRNKINAFAYVDDLAMAGICKANMLDAMNIVE